MGVEARLQSKIVKWLRSKGCYTLVTTPGGGIPTGCPDIIALVPGGGWIAIEVKASNPYRKDGKAKAGAFRPLQLETLKLLGEMYYARSVWPDNWDEIKADLEKII